MSNPPVSTYSACIQFCTYIQEDEDLCLPLVNFLCTVCAPLIKLYFGVVNRNLYSHSFSIPSYYLRYLLWPNNYSFEINHKKTPGSNGVWGKSGSSISAVKAPPAPTSSLSAAVSASSSTSFKTPPGRGGGRGNSSSSGGRGIGGGGRTSHNSHGGGGSGFSKTPGGKYGGGASTPNHNTPSNRKTPQDGNRPPPNKHNNHATSPAS
jgi:hypothetical protein